MAERRAVRELPIGTKGLAFEDISTGKTGEAWFTIEGKLERIEVYAVENIRKFREIQIIALDNRAIEATPTELKFEKVDGTWQRVTETYPLPVSMGRKAVTWTDSVLITASGATELVSAPGSGKRLRIHGICLSNKHTVSVDVALSEKTDGTELKFRHVLAAEGGNVDLNLTDTCWDLSENTALQYYPQAAYSGGVLVSVGYTTEDVG
jgi:hypothetical protein